MKVRLERIQASRKVGTGNKGKPVLKFLVESRTERRRPSCCSRKDVSTVSIFTLQPALVEKMCLLAIFDKDEAIY